MKHHVIGSLTAAFVMSAFSAPLSSHAQQIEDREPARQIDASSSLDREDENSPEPTAFESARGHRATSTPARDIIYIHSHALDDRQAATLYVQGIPVLTFVGGELASLDQGKRSAEASAEVSQEPVLRATAVGARIEQFQQNQGNAETIAARWDDEAERYVISLADDDLVVINSQTILPDTTGSVPRDTLHVANRLRRLLGSAAPLDAIAGRPQAMANQVAIASVSSGMASWYGPGFHGRRSASGEVFNQHALTAAHRTLPFGTRVRVTNLRNNQQVVVRINDRGPYSHGRVIDLSAGAARAIGLARMGVGPVRLEVLQTP
ncbi:putative endolytic peptidoglycan transglycosylase RlpA [Halomicronema hongdechloris C2206]|uniref:Probable endolytic peptidoglycan transglycosylase RlpA n=1 Tax=Halomicronema hongdechloris C2206 TaxID=1641165 RepID=A0A1Z3HN10_9CYAN|nr:septal ring lytic transglycosylase RlpA family protein [Halomicronema hongdechloris]ASC71537.1 putative endolytic peptidoglycan transglycosylase RlpA [Halomicronema hongdechloris C2206]